jgi:glucose-1-phosphate thymidylyltransferase
MGNVIGLIPAGGHARRVEPLPCSKELFPIGFLHREDEKHGRPKVVCHYLLEKMRAAGIAKAYIVLRRGKWDIPAYLQDGGMFGMHLAYLMRGLPYGVPYTVDQAYSFVRDEIIAFGFPDILFQPEDAFVQLLAKKAASNADIILGLFPTDCPQEVDMVNFDKNGRVRQIEIKPRQTQLRFTWSIAVWTSVFTAFMHEHLAILKGSAAGQPELSMGHVIEAAVSSDLRVEAVIVSNEPYLDVGTPENLLKAIRNVGCP